MNTFQQQVHDKTQLREKQQPSHLSKLARFKERFKKPSVTNRKRNIILAQQHEYLIQPTTPDPKTPILELGQFLQTQQRLYMPFLNQI